MVAVSSIGAIDQRDRSLYLRVQNRLTITLRKSYPRHTLTGCRFVSQEEMDRIFPSDIENLVIEEVAAKLNVEFDAEQHVLDHLNDHADANCSRLSAMGPANYGEITEKIAQWVRDYILSGDAVAEERINAYCRNDADLGPILADLTAALTYKNARSKELQKEYGPLQQRYHLFTAMGCYVKGVIYLCPERMAKAASSADLPLEELVEVMWTHEEMHSLLDCHLSREMEEHIAQSMTAAAMLNCDKRGQIDTMIALARNQPRHYGLFSKGLDLGSAPKQRREHRRRGRLRRGTAPTSSAPAYFLPEVTKRIEEATGGRATELDKGMMVTSSGKFLVGNILDGKEGTSKYDLILDMDALSSMPVESTFVVLSMERQNRTMSYVVPASWFATENTRGAPGGKRMRGVMRLSFTLGDQSYFSEFKDNYRCLK